MPLEDPTQIDLITTSDDGSVNLVITDSGLTADPAERLRKLLTKLRVYVNYAVSEEFRAAYPDVPPEKVSIVVVCATPPTPEMRNIMKVTPHNDRERQIAVRYEIFTPTLDGPAPDTGSLSAMAVNPKPTIAQGCGKILMRIMALALLVLGALSFYIRFTLDMAEQDGWSIFSIYFGVACLAGGVMLYRKISG